MISTPSSGIRRRARPTPTDNGDLKSRDALVVRDSDARAIVRARSGGMMKKLSLCFLSFSLYGLVLLQSERTPQRESIAIYM
jgi:hypothetical protein